MISQNYNQVFLFTFVLLAFYFAQPNAFGQNETVRKAQNIVNEVIKRSFPELRNKTIELKTFKSETDYFQARFSIGRMLTSGKMRFLILVNPKVFEKKAPENGVRAILAHELGHILFYSDRNRLKLLGLVKLISKEFNQKFERRTDLVAIARGYAEGLIEYRQWLYQNIPVDKISEKKRNYFSPEEIEIIVNILKQKPEMMRKWQKNVPLGPRDLLP